jgi:cobalt-zinc-cadmium efflux system outer membrane protein
MGASALFPRAGWRHDGSADGMTGLAVVLSVTLGGCGQFGPSPDYLAVDRGQRAREHQPPASIRPGDPDARDLDPPPTPPELLGVHPVDDYIRRALAENRDVQAAWFRVQALRARIPQATALDDPLFGNTIFPSPKNGLQTASGYIPYSTTLTQMFPWFGTLRLRGQVADKEVCIALHELAAAQLRVIARVKRAYFNLYFNQRAEGILLKNRKLASENHDIARFRYQTGKTTQQDVLRAKVAIHELDNQLDLVHQGSADARAALARQLHVNPDSDLRTVAEIPISDVPVTLDRLYRIATAARPELQANLAAIDRDRRAVELARKRYYPNITLGAAFQMVTKDGALAATATGNDNIGLFVGFNLPIYRNRIAASVAEAESQTVADAKRYEDLRDETYEDVKELFVEAKTERAILERFRAQIVPLSRQALQSATSDYVAATQDFVTLITAWQALLQYELEAVRLESALGKTLASLEQVVGVEFERHPVVPAPPGPEPRPVPLPPSPVAAPGPFARPGLGAP